MGQSRKWQYQTEVKPIFFNPEVTTPDRYAPECPQHCPKPSLLDAIHSGSFFSGDIPRESTNLLSMWEGFQDVATPQRRRSLLEAIKSGSFFPPNVPRPEDPFITKWKPTFPDHLTRRVAISDAIQAGSFFFGDIPRTTATPLVPGEWLEVSPGGGIWVELLPTTNVWT